MRLGTERHLATALYIYICIYQTRKTVKRVAISLSSFPVPLVPAFFHETLRHRPASPKARAPVMEQAS